MRFELTTSDIQSLKQPCKNRDIELINNGDGTVTMNGVHVNQINDAYAILETTKRTDFDRYKPA